jgi:hypothetical protein
MSVTRFKGKDTERTALAFTKRDVMSMLFSGLTDQLFSLAYCLRGFVTGLGRKVEINFVKKLL